MNNAVQTLELAGRRFVVVPEEDFRKLEQDARIGHTRSIAGKSQPKFASVARLKVSGIPASQLLIQDRR